MSLSQVRDNSKIRRCLTRVNVGQRASRPLQMSYQIAVFRIDAEGSSCRFAAAARRHSRLPKTRFFIPNHPVRHRICLAYRSGPSTPTIWSTTRARPCL